MKKSILTLCVAAATLCTASAQIVVDANGELTTGAVEPKPFFPQKGDYGLAIDATPFLNYVGNFFSGTTAAPVFQDVSRDGFTINTRYFIADDKATLAGITLGTASTTVYTTNAIDTNVEDKTSTNFTINGARGGLEMKRFKGNRIMGTMGTLAVYNNRTNGAGNIKFEDGNDAAGNYKITGGRLLQIGAGATLGAEYFFTPYMSFGGMFTVLALYSNTNDRIRTNEDGSEQILARKTNGFGIGNNSFQGNLSFNVYF